MADLHKSQSYHSSPDAPQESIDRINRRLQGEMRARIRQIAPAPIASEKWFEVLEHLRHLAAVAVMEEFGGDRGLGFVEGNSSGVAALGKSQESSTVWERDGLCVRLVVEEGKVNLLTRMLADFKREVVTSNGAIVDAYGAKRSQAREYEMGLGLILRSGLTAVEAVQTLDVRALLDHVALCLDNALNSQTAVIAEEPDDIFMQEFLSMSYLALIAQQLGSINEDVTMTHFIGLQLLEKIIAHGEKYAAAAMARYVAPKDFSITSAAVDVPVDYLSQELVHAYCNFFRLFFDSDTFKTQTATFFPNRAAKARFVSVFEPVVKLVMGATPDAETKKRYRPLTDVLLRFK